MQVNDKLVLSLIKDLVHLGKTSPAYVEGQQWAVNAMVTARFIINDEERSIEDKLKTVGG